MARGRGGEGVGLQKARLQMGSRGVTTLQKWSPSAQGWQESQIAGAGWVGDVDLREQYGDARALTRHPGHGTAALGTTGDPRPGNRRREHHGRAGGSEPDPGVPDTTGRAVPK